jgi:hypothetical protein
MEMPNLQPRSLASRWVRRTPGRLPSERGRESAQGFLRLQRGLHQVSHIPSHRLSRARPPSPASRASMTPGDSGFGFVFTALRWSRKLRQIPRLVGRRSWRSGHGAPPGSTRAAGHGERAVCRRGSRGPENSRTHCRRVNARVAAARPRAAYPRRRPRVLGPRRGSRLAARRLPLRPSRAASALNHSWG